MSKTTITKSIRLSPDESEEVAQLSAKTAVTEATLMRKWIQEGIKAQKMELAVQAYMQRQCDLRGGAAMAGVSYNRFLDELQSRHIVVLEDDGRFQERLAYLAESFGDASLQQALAQLAEKNR
jgi:predicted DNA-binding protein